MAGLDFQKRKEKNVFREILEQCGVVNNRNENKKDKRLVEEQIYFGTLVLGVYSCCGNNVKDRILSKHLLQRTQQHGG